MFKICGKGNALIPQLNYEIRPDNAQLRSFRY